MRRCWVLAALLSMLSTAEAQTVPAPPRFLLGPPPEVLALERTGRQQKGGGIALITIGSALLATSTALTITGAWNDGSATLLYGGMSTAVLGAVALSGGISLFLYGADQVRRARALRLSTSF